MISKIIQKEKERQEEMMGEREFFRGKEGNKLGVEYCLLCKNDWEFCKCKEIKGWDEKICIHKQSLINLKEYMEEQFQFCRKTDDWQGELYLAKDIKELKNMIEKYG